MRVSERYSYYKRIVKAYLTGSASQLSFWHGLPRVNDQLDPTKIGQYYMQFFEKADYQGPFDKNGIPMLDYHGEIGVQYNPIAISQYALGNYNLYKQTKENERYSKFINASIWLLSNLSKNDQGLRVWMHHFIFEYRNKLVPPWYSGLAQGQGLSVLVRAFHETNDETYMDAANQVFDSFCVSTDNGGVVVIDEKGNTWIEEYIVSPPSHILNGFIWALWGVYDYYLITGSRSAQEIFDRSVNTLVENLHRYDLGYWSLYELSDVNIRNIASAFYHKLHTVQLDIMYDLTGEDTFLKYADRWESYQNRAINRWRAFIRKVFFKVLYY